MRKLICRILVLFIIATNLVTIKTNAIPYLDAEGVVLMDAKTGEILFSKNPDKKFLPASTTKVMTAIVVLNKCKLDEEVTIGKNPPYADGSSLGIREGEIYTVEELLIGLLLTSGNDTAEALAEYVSGSVEEFGKLMTETAHKLGATNSTFTNPSGLDEITQNFTTAHDLSIILREAIKYPDFVRISKMDAYKYETKPYTDGTERWAVSSNKVMRDWSPWYCPYVIAGKTGYTDAAHHTYTAAAEKDGQLLIASYLNGVDKNALYSSVNSLFEYGFDNFKTVQVVKEGDLLSEYKINDNITIPLISDKDYYITQQKNEESENKISVKYDDRDISKQPITKGEELFKGKLLVNGEEINDISLLSGADREYNNKIARKESINKFLSNRSQVTALVISLILLILLVVKVLSGNNKRKRLKAMRKKFNIKK